MYRAIRWLLAAGFVTVVFANATKALPIPQYDKMDYNDQGNFVTSLIKGVYLELSAEGQAEQADKVLAFFKEPGENGGWRQFDKNLEIARNLNLRHSTDPNYTKPAYEVENVMSLTLKDNGIVISVSKLQAITKDFKPSHPPANGDAPKKNSK